MPIVDLGYGESISALEFFQAIHAQAPLALKHEGWLRLTKMAFTENRVDALQLAKQQAVQIQRQGMGELAGLSMPMPMPMPTPQYPTTYYHPQPQPQPIIFSPQITVNPTIAPTITANPTNTHSNTHSNKQTANPYGYHEPYNDLVIWLGMFFATLAIVILVLG